jgi:hypothetical protein
MLQVVQVGPLGMQNRLQIAREYLFHGVTLAGNVVRNYFELRSIAKLSVSRVDEP